MKIIHMLLGKANRESMNGINNVVDALAFAQHRDGQDVEVWGLTETPKIRPPSRNYRLRLFRSFRWLFYVDPALARAIADLPDDSIIHLHGAMAPQIIGASRVMARHHVPYVITPHGALNPLLLLRKWWLRRPFLLLFDRRLFVRSRAIHALTPAERIAILRQVAHPRVVVIPNGQDLAAVCHNGPLPERPQRPVFGFCGRLDIKAKGLDLLLEGFARYRESGGRGVLWFIGDGPSRSRLERKAKKLGLVRHVRFLGVRSGNDKLTHIAAMDIFVHSSRTEGMPTAVLEAAALSRPLIISRETNLADFVENAQCGLVLTQNDPAHIAEAMAFAERSYETSALEAYGNNALEMVRDAFDWTTIGRRLCREVYAVESRSS